MISTRVAEKAQENSSLTRYGYATENTAMMPRKIKATLRMKISVARIVALICSVSFLARDLYNDALVAPPTPARSSAITDKNWVTDAVMPL